MVGILLAVGTSIRKRSTTPPAADSAAAAAAGAHDDFYNDGQGLLDDEEGLLD